jgi:hypothetical protein
MESDPPRGRQTLLPLAAERNLVGDRCKARRHVDVGREPVADLLGEALFVLAEREIHQEFPKRSARHRTGGSYACITVRGRGEAP